MRTISGPLVLLLLGSGFGMAAAENGPQVVAESAPVQPPPPAGMAGPKTGPAEVDANSVILPCIPVAAYWTGPPQSEGMPPGPELAIVDTDVRPKDARVYLDGRFVGRARYLDGKPGYLYLAPGSYRLELRFDGYQTVSIALAAEAGCRFDLKHRLERVPGTKKEQTADYGKGKPFNRVFAPLVTAAEKSSVGQLAGPDLDLRPDLGRADSDSSNQRPVGAAVKLRVSPDSASIVIDGTFVATAGELQRMERPLAVSAGSHLIEVSAPGYEMSATTIEPEAGEVIELSVDLTESPAKPK